MRKKFQILLSLLLLIIVSGKLEAAIPYQIDIQGIECENVKELIRVSSQLYSLQNTPPTTRLGLKKRTEGDIGNIITALHSQGYWGAKVIESYDFEHDPVVVILQVNTGPIYPFSKFTVLETGDNTCLEMLSPDYFGIVYGEPALPVKIRAAEEGLIAYYHDMGYPYPSLEATDVVADQASESVIIHISIKKGPQMVFGDVFIKGNECVRKAYIFKNLAWSKGQLYCPRKIKATRRDLERAGLFTFVDIFYDETPSGTCTLPIHIDVKEGKNRTIGIGANFQTQRGFGVSGEWEHRNFQGMGEVMTIKTNLWSDKQVARLSYLQPDLFCKGEDLISLFELNREITEGYTTKSFSAFSRIEKDMGKKLKISYGIGFKHLRDTHIHEKKNHDKQKIHNEEFSLVKSPLSAFYNSTDDLLDPRNGITLRFSTTPSVSVTDQIFFYSINTLTFTYYKPLWKEWMIFAFRTTLGSIFGAPKTTIPRSELFDAGGDMLLRGYHYKTVSPLDNDHDPTGGRSMLISSLEIRTRWTKEFGSVLFFDFGNVYGYTLPDLEEKMLSSIGLGIRYYTLVGPIRLDVAIPLTPRKHVDNQHYQIYFSVGQAF